MLLEIIDLQEWSVEKQVVFILGVWMGQYLDLNLEKKVLEVVGIGQVIVNCILNCEGFISIGVLLVIVRVFGCDVYELILLSGNVGLIDYDYYEYVGLLQEEKNKIIVFIKFIVSQN